MNGKNDISGKAFVALFKSVMISLGVAVAVCATLLALCTAMALSTSDPVSLAWLGSAVLLFGSAVCGFVCGRLHGCKGALCGALCSAGYIGVIIALWAIFASDRGINGLMLASSVIVCIIFACLGCSTKSRPNTVKAGMPAMKKQKKSVYFNGLNK